MAHKKIVILLIGLIWLLIVSLAVISQQDRLMLGVNIGNVVLAIGILWQTLHHKSK